MRSGRCPGATIGARFGPGRVEVDPLVQVIGSVSAVLLALALLVAGHGLQLTVLPLLAVDQGLGTAANAASGSAYFAGFLVGCLTAPLVIRRAGHIRAFSTFNGLLAVALLALSQIGGLPALVLLRALAGCAVAGMYTIVESWICERATAATRGRLFAAYTMISLLMLTVGQWLVALPLEHAQLLILAAVLVNLAALPLTLTRSIQPTAPDDVRLDLRSLLALSPSAVTGAVVVGLVTGAYWTLGPVYAAAVGLSEIGLTAFLSAVLLGGTLAQYPLGWLSDRTDRRRVLLGAMTCGAGASVLLMLLPPGSAPSWFVVAAVFGACSFSMYAICVAHANDRADGEDFVRNSSGLLLCYALGAISGPAVASACITLLGPAGLFAGFAALLGCGAMVLLFELFRQRAPMHAADFVALPRATPQAFEMDPRGADAAEPAAVVDGTGTVVPLEPAPTSRAA